MAAQYITKKSKHKGKIVETTYRIDADFIPSCVAEVCLEYIENYCVAHNETDWLVQECSITSFQKEVKNKNTGRREIITVKCKSYPFVNLRADFVHKFFPQILKSEGERPETFVERIKRLYGKR